MDGLTQVNNRNAMNERVDSYTSGSVKLPDAMGVAFADLNGLKTVNDDEGHDAGDKLLRRAASLLKIAFGDYEIYRAGGDEFVVILKRVASMHAPTLVEGFLKRLESDPGTQPWEHVSAAVGYWTYGQDGAVTIESIFEHADHQMYAHKASMKALRVD